MSPSEIWVIISRMLKKVKAIILGLSNSGKSSVAEILLRNGWPIFEVDDEAFRRNDVIWEAEEDVMDRLFKQINDEVINFEEVVFVTSFLEISDIKRFKDKGFMIIELHADYEELIRRKTLRDKPTQEKLERYDKNYKNYVEIIKETEYLFDLSLDTTNSSPEEIAGKIDFELKRR